MEFFRILASATINYRVYLFPLKEPQHSNSKKEKKSIKILVFDQIYTFGDYRNKAVEDYCKI